MSEPSEDVRDEIVRLVLAREKIAAIKVHREATGQGLKESKDFIEALTARLLEERPDDFQPAGKGCAAAVLLVATLSGGVWWLC